MGEIHNQPFQLSFNPFLKVDFQRSCVTSDGGLILLRELDEPPGFGELIEQHLPDSRHGKNTQFPFADLLRQSVSEEWVGNASVLGFSDIPAGTEKALESKPGWCVAC